MVRRSAGGKVKIRWLFQGLSDLPPADDWLTEREAARMAGMAFPKRRGEFRLRRWTAKRALGSVIGIRTDELSRFEIGSAADGAPASCLDGRPTPLSISLSDRAGWAVCVVADGPAAVGCDLELVEPRSEAFIEDYLTASERQLVKAANDEQQRYLLANLIWSAKESALKVLRTGLRRDTRSVEVSLSAASEAECWSALRVGTRERTTIHGWWRRCGSFLLTTAADRPLSRPIALIDPPCLADAVPRPERHST
ncbi:MAG: 4'-phosphopantetheinyl transferase superfamily protein [Acidobacteriota bacterium]|nr:MAG: 4'-phosphopantetheinyl transferase superfamily protein [Acidobacteriota bacterium]